MTPPFRRGASRGEVPGSDSLFDRVQVRLLWFQMILGHSSCFATFSWEAVEVTVKVEEDADDADDAYDADDADGNGVNGADVF